jgi:hypothetical protein
MTPHQTLAVAVRLFVIWLAIYVGREFFGFYSGASDKDFENALPIVVILGLVAILVLVVLWFFPKSVARGLLTQSTDTQAAPSAPQVWLAVGSSLIGLWLLASAVPALLRNTWVAYLYGPDFKAYKPNTAWLVDGLLFYTVQSLVGLGLIIRANGIAKLIWWARTAGTGETSNTAVASDADREFR